MCRQWKIKRQKLGTFLPSTRGFSVDHPVGWDLELPKTRNDPSVPERFSQRNVPNYAATAVKIPNNRNECPNEAVAHETSYDLSIPTHKTHKWMLKERAPYKSYHSKEHIPHVAPCEDNQQHIQNIAHDTDALEQTCLVDLNNYIGHDDDCPNVFPSHILQPDPTFTASLSQIIQGLHFGSSWEHMLDYISLYNRTTITT